MKRLTLILLTILLGTAAQSQQVYNSSGGNKYTKKKKQDAKGFDPQKLIIGGGLGLGFGTVTTVNVSPIVGYRFTEKFAAGVGIGYNYVKSKNFFRYGNQNFDYKASIYSASAWGRYLVFNNVFAQVEYEQNFIHFSDYEFDNVGNIREVKVKYNAPALLVGAGLRQPVSDRASLTVMVLYDVIQNKYSPYYGVPVYRVGFNVGF